MSDVLDGLRALSLRALGRWGHQSQIDMVLEECGELIAAVNRHRRGRCSLADLAGEVADVEIIIDQLRIILGDGLVDNAKRSKLRRLAARLDEGEGIS